MIRIRLRRTGKKHRPFYRVVVANQPDKRDGAFLETLGSYDPHVDPPSITINAERTLDWISKGAQPSEAAEKILRRAGVIAGPASATAAVAVAEPPVKMSKKARAKAAAAPAVAPVAAAPADDAQADAPATEATAADAPPEEARVAAESPAAPAPDEVGAEAPADEPAVSGPDGE